MHMPDTYQVKGALSGSVMTTLTTASISTLVYMLKDYYLCYYYVSPELGKSFPHISKDHLVPAHTGASLGAIGAGFCITGLCNTLMHAYWLAQDKQPTEYKDRKERREAYRTCLHTILLQSSVFTLATLATPLADETCAASLGFYHAGCCLASLWQTLRYEQTLHHEHI